jgi:hypothetical protein
VIEDHYRSRSADNVVQSLNVLAFRDRGLQTNLGQVVLSLATMIPGFLLLSGSRKAELLDG